MKTAFERDNYRFIPESVIYITGPDGRARVMRPWLVYRRVVAGWLPLGKRYYSPRTPKKDIQ